MGHKPRIKGVGAARVILDEPKSFERLRQTSNALGMATFSDKDLFLELGRRGYECSEFRGSPKKSMHFVKGDVVPKFKFILHVPPGQYPHDEDAT